MTLREPPRHPALPTNASTDACGAPTSPSRLAPTGVCVPSLRGGPSPLVSEMLRRTCLCAHAVAARVSTGRTAGTIAATTHWWRPLELHSYTVGAVAMGGRGGSAGEWQRGGSGSVYEQTWARHVSSSAPAAGATPLPTNPARIAMAGRDTAPGPSHGTCLPDWPHTAVIGGRGGPRERWVWMGWRRGGRVLSGEGRTRQVQRQTSSLTSRTPRCDSCGW